MKKTYRLGKALLSLALIMAVLCPSVCAVAEETVTTDHVWINRTMIKPATCVDPPYYRYECQLCGEYRYTYEGSTNPNAHEWGEWTVTKEANCTEEGSKERICTLAPAHHKQTQVIPAIGHKYVGTVTTEPTCTEPGVKTYVCQNDSSHTYKESIPATGHDWDNGKITKEPTCTEPGVKTYTCKNDSSHTKQESVPATGHNWDTGAVTKEPTCTEPGERTYTCLNDSSHTRKEPIAPTGHSWDNGVIIKQPTFTEEGLIEYTCQKCGVKRQEKLPRKVMGNNTICAFGPRLRDVNLAPYNTDAWYMFTPFDASKDGRQTYELVATNKYIVGTLTIDIRNGEMTIDYDLVSNTIDITLEFFTVLSQLDDIHEYEPEKLLDLRMSVRRPINLQDTFGDDRNLVLYFCSRCNYTYSERFKDLNYNSAAHQRLVKQMLEIMD